MEKENTAVEEVRRFWRHLFVDNHGMLHLWTGIRDENGEFPKKTIQVRNFDYPDDAESAALWALKKSEAGREVYFCCHILTGPERSKDNAAPVSALWLDLDDAPLPNGEYRPTAVVESSPGRFHAYLRLDEALPPRAAENLNRRLARKLGADSGWSLTKLLRVPGTLNHKREDPVPVKLLGIRDVFHSGRTLDELLPKIEEPPSKNGHGETEDTTSTPVEVVEPPVRLPARALRFWRGEDYVRDEDGALDRSRSLFKVGALLREHGATQQTIVAALAERDVALGWRKYADREDQAERYAEIASKLERGEKSIGYTGGGAPDGAALLHELAAFIRRFVVLSREQAQLIALWIIHTYAFDAAETTPYLHIKSAEKRSGKSRLLEVLELLANGAWYTGRVTPAVLIRKIAAEQPTLLLDESDAAFNASQEYTETLRGVLNAGFRRGGVASLCVGQGANIDYKDFPVYSPKAIAGIGRLPDTVADRSIPIDLKRRKKGEEVARFRRRNVEADALLLRERAAAWVESIGIEELASREVELPEALDDRAQDIVEPLLAIADVVGGAWPEIARSSAVALLTGEEREDQESLGVRLLADIKAVFEQEEEETVRSSSVVAELRHMTEAPWDDFKGSGLTAQRMAQLLKPYGVKSKKLRTGEKTFQGFERGQFEDAWARYLPEDEKTDQKGANPPVPPSQVGTSEHYHTYGDYGDSKSEHGSEQKTRSERSNHDTYRDVPTFRPEGVYTEDEDPVEGWEGEL